MERFTKRLDDGRVVMRGDGTPKENMLKIPGALNKLCEFEDTEERGGWISVKDRLPEDGVINANTLDYQKYMAIFSTGEGVRDARPLSYAEGMWLQYGSDVTGKVSHWLDNPPLPEPPKEEKRHGNA